MSKVLVLLNIDLSSPKQFDFIDQDLGEKLKSTNCSIGRDGNLGAERGDR